MTISHKFTLPAFLMAIIFIAVGCSDATHQDSTSDETSPSSDTSSTSYNSELAEELGADDYGMRQYVMAFLKAGPNPSADSTEAMELQRAHLDNIRRMAEAGDLVLAGPFMDNGEIRGIYVFDVRTVEEARELTETDPAIQSGALEMELRPWYGSAALIQINDVHGQISKENP